jgi:L-alanine-DL-glutamate epimerase-like enolase superfamily enzyme
MNASIRIGSFDTRFRFRFKHASADRSSTENVIVEVRDREGVCGYGEGCPRSYVTGENSANAIDFLAEHASDIVGHAPSHRALKDWIASNGKTIDAHPAAFCALEIALIDMFARRAGQSVELLLGLPPLSGTAKYSAIIGDGSPTKTAVYSMVYRALGLGDFKVKLSRDPAIDRRRFDVLPKRARIRVDANNLFGDADECARHIRELKRPIWAIEEPLAAGDFDNMRKIASELDCRIILDESLTRIDELQIIEPDPSIWILNLRVSKCGGIVRTIALACAAEELGAGVVIGAHVGETSLLTRSALCAGQALAKPPLAREGAFGDVLLASDLTEPSIKFGRGGMLAPSRKAFGHSPGLGLSVKSGAIRWVDETSA